MIFQWPNSVVTGLAPGTYNLIVLDANECQLEQEIEIPLPPDPVVDLDDNGIDLEFGDSTNIVAVTTDIDINNILDITWTPVNAVECLSDPCLEVQVHGDFPTTLRVTITTENGCIAEDQIQVRVEKDFNVYFPNIFSPGSTGPESNNFFRPYVDTRKVAKVEDFIVVDRWGEIVYQRPIFDFINGADLGWDGSLDGRPLNPAVFVYYARVTFIDGTVEEFAGDVTLIR